MRQPKCFCRSLVCLWGWTPKCYLQHSVPIVFCCQQRRKEDFLNLKKKIKLESEKKMLAFLLSCIVQLQLLGGFDITEDPRSILSRVGCISLHSSQRKAASHLLVLSLFWRHRIKMVHFSSFCTSEEQAGRARVPRHPWAHRGSRLARRYGTHTHHRHEKNKRQGRRGGRVRGRGMEVDYSTLLFSTLASKTSIKYQNHL